LHVWHRSLGQPYLPELQDTAINLVQARSQIHWLYSFPPHRFTSALKLSVKIISIFLWLLSLHYFFFFSHLAASHNNYFQKDCHKAQLFYFFRSTVSFTIKSKTTQIFGTRGCALRTLINISLLCSDSLYTSVEAESISYLFL
jgi:hypothetical protein